MPIINKTTAKVRLFIGKPEGLDNIVLYNYNSENNLPVHTIVERMKRRLLSGKHAGTFLRAVFYDAQTNEILEQI